MSTLRTSNLIHGSSAVSNVVLDTQGRALFGPDGPNGRAALYVNPQTNRVGVNTESPAVALDVDGAINTTGNVTIGGTLNLTNALSINTLNAGSGTAAAPSVSVGTTDNGLYSPGTDQVAISTNGTGRLFFDSSGRVGIGTSSPSALLHLRSDTPYIRIDDVNDSQSWQIEGRAFFGIYDATNTTFRLAIDGSGKVGVGTTSPGKLLSIQDSTTPSLALYTSSTIRGELKATSALTSLLSYSNSPITFNIGGTAETEAVRIDGSGRMLLGTTTEGYATFGDNLTVADSGHCGVTIRSGTSSQGNIYFSDATSGTAEYTGIIQYLHDVNAMAFGVNNGVERMRISADGSITATGSIVSGGNPSSGAAQGTLVGSFGGFNACRTTATDSVFIGYTQGNSTATVDLRANGSAEFTNTIISSRNDTQLYNSTVTGTAGLPCFYSKNRATASANSYVSIGFSVGASNTARGAINLISEDGGRNSAFAFQQRKNSSDGYETLRIDSSGRLLIGTSSAFISGDEKKLQMLHAGAGAEIILGRDDQSVGSGNSLGAIKFVGNAGSYQIGAEIEAKADGTQGDDDKPTRLEFSTTADGSSSPTERMRIDSLGNLYIGDSSDYGTNNYSQTTGSGNWLYRHDDSGSVGGCVIHAHRKGGFAGYYFNLFDWASGEDLRWFDFYKNGSTFSRLQLTTNGNNIELTNQSDYRLKQDVDDYTGALEIVKQLKPKTYNWISNPEHPYKDTGFIAHEIQEVLPDIVSGEKDEMGHPEDLNEEGKPVVSSELQPIYQSLDMTRLIPTLTAALKEAIAKIETLETKVAALEVS